MSTLYRKYRPQSFKELIGQNHIKITLERELERGEIGHAYLFCGPRGLGKTTTARLFAKAVNCENRKEGESEPCNKCSSCLDIQAGRNVDMIEIDAASHTGVDNVRENIIENARFTPNRGRYKVFIIDEAHMLSTAAFNALLKTLEEPPAHVIFILCTTESHKLPQTIISRCQRFDFKRVNSDEMAKLLKTVVKAEGKKIDDGVVKSIIANSDGCVRDAESLLGKVLTLGDDISAEQAELVLPKSDFGLVADFVGYLLDKNPTAAIELVNRAAEDGVDLEIFSDGLVEFLRKVMLYKTGAALAEFGIDLDEDGEKAIERLAARFDFPQLVSAIELFLEARREVRTAFIRQFPLEMAALVFCEGINCSRDEDEPKIGGGSGGLKSEAPARAEAKPESGVKNKIKEKLAKLAHHREEGRKEQNEEQSVGKVDLLSKEDKLKPASFVDLDKIISLWPQIVAELLKQNYTLAALLKISRPLKTRENILEIGVKSAFYCERLAEEKNCRLIEETISNAALCEVLVRGVLKPDVEPMEFETREEQLVAGSPVATPAVMPAFPAKKDAAKEVLDMF